MPMFRFATEWLSTISTGNIWSYRKDGMATVIYLDGKVWVQHDGMEDGVTDDLVAAGIPKKEIVWGFHEPAVRKHQVSR